MKSSRLIKLTTPGLCTRLSERIGVVFLSSCGEHPKTREGNKGMCCGGRSSDSKERRVDFKSQGLRVKSTRDPLEKLDLLIEAFFDHFLTRFGAQCAPKTVRTLRTRSSCASPTAANRTRG